MNAKQTAQIAAMKSQTFGVEVEMYNITREYAAEVAADFFGTGQTSYLAGGYKTWVCYDNDGRAWKFERDASILASSDAERCELVTPILTYEDTETLQQLIRELRKAGAKSDPRHGCGIHIHVGLQDHTAKTLRNLVNLMHSHEDLLIDSIAISSYRCDNFCHTVSPSFLDRLNREKPATMQKLADVWYESHNADYGRSQHYNRSRYRMLNLHACFTKGTIEFRLFQFDNPGGSRLGGLHAGQLKSYIQLCLAMSQMAKQLRSASPVKPQTENAKFAMRTWLVRLGFIGEEFATARDLLTRRLTGDLAWRHGRPANRTQPEAASTAASVA